MTTYAVESWPAETRGRAAFILSSFPVGGMVAAALSRLVLPALAAGTGLAGGLLVCAACYLLAAGVMTLLPATGARARDLDTAGPTLPAAIPMTDSPMTTERETR